MGIRSNRRQFIQGTAAAGIGYWVAGGIAAEPSKSPNERIRFACIGIGGKGDSDSDHAAVCGDIVAICDVREEQLARKASKAPFAKAAKYTDFRKLLEEMEGSIDAVTVSTPDHTHAPAAAMAIRKKKHVYCQKPLTTASMRRASSASSRESTTLRRRWGIKERRCSAFARRHKSSSQAPSARSRKFTSGLIAPFGRKERMSPVPRIRPKPRG